MTLYKKVFLADDDEDDHMFFVDALNEIDDSIHCYHAMDGELALQALSGDILERPEIIFLDLNMPKVNGLEVLMKKRRMKEFSAIPVIMYSTFFSDKDIEQTIEATKKFFK